MAKASDVTIGVQTGTERTMYATWTWTTKNTDHYSVKWYYATGDGIWFIGSETTVTARQSLYSAPDNANKVKFLVKPVAKTHTVNKKSVSYWTASWSTAVAYSFTENAVPEIPSVPTVTVKNYTLTAEVDCYDDNTTHIEFRVVVDDEKLFSVGSCEVVKNHAAYSCTISAGKEYKVRCRASRNSTLSVSLTAGSDIIDDYSDFVLAYSDFSEYSSNVSTIPAKVSAITSVRALSSTSVRIVWEKATAATSYEVEYTTEKRYFDSSNETQSLTVTTRHAEITGLTSGEKWYFRVRAVNDQGNSAWSDVESITIGKAPSAPTTWSSTTTATVGDKIILYWVHNSEDGSKLTYSKLAIKIKGEEYETTTIQAETTDDEDDTTAVTSSYTLDTEEYGSDLADTKIYWKVKTRGILDEYSEWSTTRTIDIYEPPTLELYVNGGLDTIPMFPLYIEAYTNCPETAVSYYVTITSIGSYDTIDQVGRTVHVASGEQIYSAYVSAQQQDLSISLNPEDVTLENNKSYRVNVTLSVSYGMTATAKSRFKFSVTDDWDYEPNAEISIDTNTFTASIRPYCRSSAGVLMKNCSLSVYRREFDGSYTELASGLNNTKNICITDPHPALDYARYRIVAISDLTGSVTYYDPPGYPVGGTSIILQWDEEWTPFDTENEDAMEKASWSGSMLKLPYDVDVSDNYDPDVTLVEYIGRENPVSYYGTQIGQTASWTTHVLYDDEETLYALRRLARYMGNVYVREPSGSGYWAQVKVSFSRTHCELLIPVTLNLTRVEGDI